MPTFGEALDAQVDLQITQAGEPLTVSRSGLTSDEFDGIYGAPTSPVSNGDTTVTARETSFIIRRSEYSPGEVSEPRIGDRITRVDTDELFEVARPDGGGSHFEKYGGRQYALRVFASRVSS